MKKDDLQNAMKDIDPRLVREASGKKTVSKKTLVGISVSALSIVLVAAIVLSAVLIKPAKSGGPSSNNGGKQGGDVLVIPGPSEGLSYGKKLGDGVVKGSSGVINDGSYHGGAPESYDLPGSSKGGYAGESAYSASDGDAEVIRDYGGYPMEGVVTDPYASYSEPAPYVEFPGAIAEWNVSAGTLTAGEWRDRDNLNDWFKLINENEWNAYLAQRKLYSNRVVKVHVADGDSVCFNVRAEVLADGKVLAGGRTDVNGDVVLAYDILGNQNVKPDTVRILGKDTAIEDGASDISVDISSEEGYDKPYKLDLMLMIDTTGSMGDEISYLAAELSDMVKRISESGKQLSIRVSVNFYRDETDDYVVKYYDFRENIDECIEQIRQEYASGGGDMPEAVHKALSNAVSGHEWRADAVKLCFLVLDAPPHTESEVQGIGVDIANSLLMASEYGIRIIPVYCSSDSGNETEFILRSYALVTGGTFIFLTDHSGIGNPHAEPTVGEYDVEFLNDCMVRVTCEYLGLEYTAPEAKIPAVQDGSDANGN